MIIFLVGTNSHIKGVLSFSGLNDALTDFIEQYEEESQLLTKRDYQEIERIKQNPFSLTNSYLFKKIEPFLLPWYEHRNAPIQQVYKI